MLEITVTNRNTEQQQKYKFTQHTILIGRQQNCDVMLDGSSVSRRHAKITLNKNILEIEDLGSGNGTFVNKNKVPQNEKIPFHHEDTIRIEEFDLNLHHSSQKNATDLKPPAPPAVVKPDPENTKVTKEQPDLVEISMIKKVLGALDQDKQPSITITSDAFKDQKAVFDDHLDELIIGRDPECHLSINSSVISRKHATISVKWGSYVITDLGSKNNTFVNGEKVQESSIKDGDEIVFGTIKAIFKNPQEFDLGAISRSIEEEKAKEAKKLDETSSFDLNRLKKEKGETDQDKPQEQSGEPVPTTDPQKQEIPSPPKDEKKPEAVSLGEKSADEKKTGQPQEIEKDKQGGMKDKKDGFPEKSQVSAKVGKKLTASEWALLLFGSFVIVLAIVVLVYLFR